VVKQLPLLGGNNGTVSPPNSLGQIPGIAETNVADPNCPTTPAINGTGPQVLQFEPVIWEAKAGSARQLLLPEGDTVGMAFWINDHGQAVGSTGNCSNTIVPPFAIGAHAVMWDSNGAVHDLGNLGGLPNPNVLGAGNVAFAINNKAQVTGLSVLPDGVNTHAFLWTSANGMQDLGTLPGDNISAGLGMNNHGDIAGASIAGPDPLNGVPKAVIWHNGMITDLNTVVPADTSLFLLTAFMINDAGQVAGFGLDLNTFEVHGFLATPMPANIAAAARGQVTLQRSPSDALGPRQHGRTF
jgi:probable HAF family extracellular repeat protein